MLPFQSAGKPKGWAAAGGGIVPVGAPLSFSLAAFMAAQSDGLWLDFSSPARLFQNTDEATPVTATGQVIGRVNDRRTGTNSPRNATQATAAAKPKYQTTGAAFDGVDDNLLTGYTAGAGANFIVAKVTVPGTLSAIQVIAGAANGAAERCWVGVDNTTGFLRCGVGASLTHLGTTDLRGLANVPVGLSFNGSTVRVFVGSAQEYEGAQTGVPTVVHPIRLGSNNNVGAASSMFGGTITSIAAGREFIDLARFNQIASQL